MPLMWSLLECPKNTHVHCSCFSIWWYEHVKIVFKKKDKSLGSIKMLLLHSLMWSHGLHYSSPHASPVQSGSRPDQGVQPTGQQSSRQHSGNHRWLRQGVLWLGQSRWNICSQWQQTSLVGRRVHLLQGSAERHPEAWSSRQRLSLWRHAGSVPKTNQAGNP